MRKVERIKPFLEVLNVLWEENSDLRFYQLIDNLMHTIDKNQDVFNIEDDFAIELIVNEIKK